MPILWEKASMVRSSLLPHKSVALTSIQTIVLNYRLSQKLKLIVNGTFNDLIYILPNRFSRNQIQLLIWLSWYYQLTQCASLHGQCSLRWWTASTHGLQGKILEYTVASSRQGHEPMSPHFYWPQIAWHCRRGYWGKWPVRCTAPLYYGSVHLLPICRGLTSGSPSWMGRTASQLRTNIC